MAWCDKKSVSEPVLLAEERKIHREYSLESGSGSFESLFEWSVYACGTLTAKTPSQTKSKAKNKTRNWVSFVWLSGTNDFDLDSIRVMVISCEEKKKKEAWVNFKSSVSRPGWLAHYGYQETRSP
jgi:hypothetical protein